MTPQGAVSALRTERDHSDPAYQVTHTYVFNPKCIKMGELYGEYNLMTNEVRVDAPGENHVCVLCVRFCPLKPRA